MIQETENKPRKKLFLGLAALCLLLSFSSIVQEIIVDHNESVQAEQARLESIASHGGSFAIDSWGIDYQKRNRHLIFVVSIFAFALAFLKRKIWALLAYLITAALAVQWIAMMIHDLSMTEAFRLDLPYPLRIATPLDWTLFLLIAVTIATNISLLLHTRRRKLI